MTFPRSLAAVVDLDPDQALPCHLVDPDLFFAESPVDVERAKALCIDCHCAPPASPRRWPGASRGASGAESSSCKASSCRASGRADGHARTTWLPDRQAPIGSRNVRPGRHDEGEACRSLSTLRQH